MVAHPNASRDCSSLPAPPPSCEVWQTAVRRHPEGPFSPDLTSKMRCQRGSSDVLNRYSFTCPSGTGRCFFLRVFSKSGWVIPVGEACAGRVPPQAVYRDRPTHRPVSIRRCAATQPAHPDWEKTLLLSPVLACRCNPCDKDICDGRRSGLQGAIVWHEARQLDGATEGWAELEESGWDALIGWCAGSGNLAYKDLNDAGRSVLVVTVHDGHHAERREPFGLGDRNIVDEAVNSYLAEAEIPPRPSGYRWFIRIPPGYSSGPEFIARIDSLLLPRADGTPRPHDWLPLVKETMSELYQQASR